MKDCIRIKSNRNYLLCTIITLEALRLAFIYVYIYINVVYRLMQCDRCVFGFETLEDGF